MLPSGAGSYQFWLQYTKIAHARHKLTLYIQIELNKSLQPCMHVPSRLLLLFTFITYCSCFTRYVYCCMQYAYNWDILLCHIIAPWTLTLLLIYPLWRDCGSEWPGKHVDLHTAKYVQRHSRTSRYFPRLIERGWDTGLSYGVYMCRSCGRALLLAQFRRVQTRFYCVTCEIYFHRPWNFWHTALTYYVLLRHT